MKIHLSNKTRNQDWIKTEYLNQKDTGVFYTIDNGDLNNNAWSNLYKITILASQVNGDLTDFPVYVNLAHLPSDFFSVVNGSGADIRITESDKKTQTAFELVSLDTANGQGELWFKAPFLSSTTDTDFYLLAGNPNVEAYAKDHIFGAQNVWSNGFVAVYHLNEDPSTGSRAIKDSTKYNNDGTSNGAMTNSDLVTGQLGKAIDFDGTNDKVTINKGSLLASQFSLALWINPTLLGPNDNFVGVWNSSGWLFRTNSATPSALEFYDGMANFTSASSTLTTGTWQYLHTKMNSSSYEIFKDGNIVAGPVTGLATPTPNTVTTIGSLVNTSYAFPGKIDNVSFSNKARSSSWIKTEYNNQNSPSTFYTTEKINRANAVMFGRMF